MCTQRAHRSGRRALSPFLHLPARSGAHGLVGNVFMRTRGTPCVLQLLAAGCPWRNVSAVAPRDALMCVRTATGSMSNSTPRREPSTVYMRADSLRTRANSLHLRADSLCVRANSLHMRADSLHMRADSLMRQLGSAC